MYPFEKIFILERESYSILSNSHQTEAHCDTLNPRKLILVLQFGFEVDTLGTYDVKNDLLFEFVLPFAEIALREQQEFVDKIFLIESSFTHKGVRAQGYLQCCNSS